MRSDENRPESWSLLSSAGAASSQGRHGRQLMAAEPFEKRPARGRDIAEIAGHMGLVQGANRIAAAGDADQLALFGAAGDLLGHGEGRLAEGRRLEGAERA